MDHNESKRSWAPKPRSAETRLMIIRLSKHSEHGNVPATTPFIGSTFVEFDAFTPGEHQAEIITYDFYHQETMKLWSKFAQTY